MGARGYHLGVSALMVLNLEPQDFGCKVGAEGTVVEKRMNTPGGLCFVRVPEVIKVGVSSPRRILPRRKYSRVIPLAQTLLLERMVASASCAPAAEAAQ